MPELAEVELYRRLAETQALGRPITEVDAPDSWYLKRGLTAAVAVSALVGRSLVAARRRGKLLLLDTSAVAAPATSLSGVSRWRKSTFGGFSPTRTAVGGAGPSAAGPEGSAGQATEEPEPPGPVLGLRFGMTGRLVVDGTVGVDHLLYSANEQRPAWDRFSLRFADGGSLVMRDPRRLGGVELEASFDRLGPDALTVTPSALALALGRSRAPLKARLLDQARIAGVGNLAADEALWRAGLDPARPAASLTPAELRRLHRHLRATMSDLLAGGGSHTGTLMDFRRPGGTCPRDGAALVRRTVGGRTTWSCPVHQR